MVKRIRRRCLSLAQVRDRRGRAWCSHHHPSKVDLHLVSIVVENRIETWRARQALSRRATLIRHIHPLRHLRPRRRIQTTGRMMGITRLRSRKRARTGLRRTKQRTPRHLPRLPTLRIWIWPPTPRKTSYASSLACFSRLRQRTMVCGRKRSVVERINNIPVRGRVHLRPGIARGKRQMARRRGTSSFLRLGLVRRMLKGSDGDRLKVKRHRLRPGRRQLGRHRAITRFMDQRRRRAMQSRPCMMFCRMRLLRLP